MTKKTTNGLSCERARAFPIEKALAKLEHFPTRATEKEAWFLSPLRSETQASFKVSKELNRWYDHGAGIGGNVIDLICLIKNCSIRETLNFLDQIEISFSFHQQAFLKEQKNTGLQLLHVQPIRHYGLIKYLLERRIAISTASKLCHEVHYRHKGRRYFAIGLPNVSGGWELRNKYYKSSISPKDISHIKNGKDKLIITEGMFDLLSLMEIHKNLQETYDFLVLNSTAFVLKALKLVDDYSCVELYLDTDKNGKQTAETLKEYSKNWRDQSVLYSEVKDINEWLISRAKKRLGEKAQDVSLS